MADVHCTRHACSHERELLRAWLLLRTPLRAPGAQRPQLPGAPNFLGWRCRVRNGQRPRCRLAPFLALFPPRPARAMSKPKKSDWTAQEDVALKDAFAQQLVRIGVGLRESYKSKIWRFSSCLTILVILLVLFRNHSENSMTQLARVTEVTECMYVISCALSHVR